MFSTRRNRDGRRILYKSHKLQLPASAPLADVYLRVGGTRGAPTPSKFNFPFSTGVSTPSTSLNLIPCSYLEKKKTPASPTNRVFVIQIPFVSASDHLIPPDFDTDTFSGSLDHQMPPDFDKDAPSTQSVPPIKTINNTYNKTVILISPKIS